MQILSQPYLALYNDSEVRAKLGLLGIALSRAGRFKGVTGIKGKAQGVLLLQMQCSGAILLNRVLQLKVKPGFGCDKIASIVVLSRLFDSGRGI